MKTAVITGASSGIGLAAANLFADSGWQVIGLCRREAQSDKITYVKCDVSSPDSVRNAFARVSELASGRLDLLVNCAGFGVSGAAELISPDDFTRQLAVNLGGVQFCSAAALPMLRACRGRIINISSAAAVFPIPFQAHYSASKAAINSLSMAMANELRPYGVKVTALMPGDVATGFTQAREKTGGGIYGDTVSRSVAVMERDETRGASPDFIARAIYGTAERRNPPPLITVGFGYKCLAFLAKILPARLINYVISKLYIK